MKTKISNLTKDIKKEIRGCYNVFFNNKKATKIKDFKDRSLKIENGDYSFGAFHSLAKHFYDDNTIDKKIIAKLPLLLKNSRAEIEVAKSSSQDDKKKNVYHLYDGKNKYKLPYHQDGRKLVTFYGKYSNSNITSNTNSDLFLLNQKSTKNIIVKMRELAKTSSNFREFKMYISLVAKKYKLDLHNEKYFVNYSGKKEKIWDFYDCMKKSKAVGGHNATPDSKKLHHNFDKKIIPDRKNNVKSREVKNFKKENKKDKFDLIILIGDNGAGKSEMKKQLTTNNSSLHAVTTFTTRNPRDKEVDGVDYHFYKIKDVEKAIMNKETIEYAVFSNNYYGCLKQALSKNQTNIIVLEPSGLATYAKSDDVNIVNIFNIKTDEDIIRSRIDDKDRAEDMIQRNKRNEIAIEFNKLPLELKNKIINIDNNSSVENTKEKILNYININSVLNPNENLSEAIKNIETYNKKELVQTERKK